MSMIVNPPPASGLKQNFRGLQLRTHPDVDKAASQVLLVRADEIVMQDGASIPTWANLVADLTVSGAGGLDTGTEGASRWYELYAIRKSSDGTKNLLWHRALNNGSDAAFTTASDAGRALRRATSTATDKLAQGLQFANAKPVPYVDVQLVRAGSVVGNVWFTLESDSSGSPSGTVLATTDKLDGSLISTSNQIIRFIFRTPATVATTTQYHLVLQGDYTRSDTVNISWRGVAAGGYANGSAKEYNGSAWSAASGVGDFYFNAYTEQNNTALTLPSGYDQYAKIGAAYNDSGSNLKGFLQHGRTTQPLALQQLASAFADINAQLLDLTAFIPPGPIRLWTLIESATAGTEGYVSPVPNGFGITTTKRLAGGTGATVAGIGYIANALDILTETQACYLRISGNTGNFFAISWEWF